MTELTRAEMPQRGYWAQERLASDVAERCRSRGYAEPIILTTVWGYKRAECPACSGDMMIQFYIQHYARHHVTSKSLTQQSADKRKNGSKYQKQEMAIASDPESWRERAKANHAKILATYGKRMVK